MLDQFAPVVAAVAPAGSLDNNLVVVLATMVIGIITTALGLWKTSSDQKHAIAMFQATHDAQIRDREQTAADARKERLEIATIDKAEREEKARQLVEVLRLETEAVRMRLEATAKGVRDRLDVTSESVRARVDASAKEVRERLELTVTQAKSDADRVVHTARADAAATLETQTARMLEAIAAAAKATGGKADAAYHEANSVNTKIEKLHQQNALQAEAITKLLKVVEEQNVGLVSSRLTSPGAPIPVTVVNEPLVTTTKDAKDGPA